MDFNSTFMRTARKASMYFAFLMGMFLTVAFLQISVTTILQALGVGPLASSVAWCGLVLLAGCTWVASYEVKSELKLQALKIRSESKE